MSYELFHVLRATGRSSNVSAHHERRIGRSHSRGAVTLEALIGIPILVIVLMACFIFGSISTIESGLRSAALEAAREAAKTPTTLDKPDANRIALAATDAVTKTLSPYGMSPASGGKVEVVVQDATNVNGLVINSQSIPSPPGPASGLDSKTVQVYVRVKFADAKVPNFLKTFGLDLSGKYFEVKAIARRDG